jgi:hypothetical protein
LPPHLSTIEELIASGITNVVQSRSTIAAAIEANAHAACSALKTNSPTLASGVKSGRVLIAGGVYELGTGTVKLVE